MFEDQWEVEAKLENGELCTYGGILFKDIVWGTEILSYIVED